MAPDELARPGLGDVIEIQAVDWGIHTEQLSAAAEFDIVRARLYGQVVRMTDDSITIAPQVFAAGEVRFALAVPWCSISQITILLARRLRDCFPPADAGAVGHAARHGGTGVAVAVG